MKIIAGLGNPGPKYETTRHNVGFLAVDRLVEEWKATGPADSFRADVYQATVDGEKILLVKPMTFMNVSGESLGPMMKFYKCAPEDLIVIHDDLDLKPLTLKLKTGGGTGGHNGLKSLDASLGGQSGYHRVRIGIGHPRGLVDESAQGKHARDVVDYVLQMFTDEELRKLDLLMDDGVRAIRMLVAGQTRQAMNEFNSNKKEG